MMFLNITPCKDFLPRLKKLNFAHVALLYPIFFPTIKSWGNALSFIMLAIALVHVIRGRDQYFLSRSKTFWFAFFALTSPFFFELIVQVFRGPFTWNALDGPSRFLIGGVILLYLSKHQDIDSVVISFSLGCLICLPVTLLYVLMFDNFYWDDRCATQILCPNALPVYILAIAINSFLYVNSSDFGNFKKLILSCVVGVPLFYILLICETRTVWIAFIFLIILILAHLFFKSKSKFIFLVSIIFICLPISYLTSPIITERVDLTYMSAKSLLTYSNESSSWNSSLGGRVGLIYLDLYLALRNMPFGLPDGVLPPYETIIRDIPFMTEHVYNMRLNAGSHCEYTAHLSRKGIIIGTLNIFFIIVFPIYLIARNMRNKSKGKNYSYVAFLTIVIMSICAIGVQVFGLKMTSMFWALYLAIYVSCVFKYEGSVR